MEYSFTVYLFLPRQQAVSWVDKLDNHKTDLYWPPPLPPPQLHCALLYSQQTQATQSKKSTETQQLLSFHKLSTTRKFSISLTHSCTPVRTHIHKHAHICTHTLSCTHTCTHTLSHTLSWDWWREAAEQNYNKARGAHACWLRRQPHTWYKQLWLLYFVKPPVTLTMDVGLWTQHESMNLGSFRHAHFTKTSFLNSIWRNANIMALPLAKGHFLFLSIQHCSFWVQRSVLSFTVNTGRRQENNPASLSPFN